MTDYEKILALTSRVLETEGKEGTEELHEYFEKEVQPEVNEFFNKVINPSVDLAKVRAHLESYWQLAIEFFDKQNYPISVFFAITLIEEIAKTWFVHAKTPLSKQAKQHFFDHEKKYKFVIPMALCINNRVRNKYGEHEEIFSKLFSQNEIFSKRNDCLYIDLNTSGVQFPIDVIKAKEAFIIVCLAGEVYAEQQGGFTHNPPEEHVKDHERILRDIDTFFDKHAYLLSE